jgi:uncharacterized protein (PEP-CTERM system associated)
MATDTKQWRAWGVLVVLSATNVGAANWVVTPDIRLRETYTDNVFIGTAERRHDFVTEATPGIRIDGRSPRLTATFDYRPSAVLYADNKEQNDVFNNLSAFGKLDVAERFFVEAAANINQTFVSPFGPQPPELVTFTQNRVETRSFLLSPYVRGDLRSGHEYELRNTNAWTRTGDEDLGEFRTRRWNGRFASPVRLFGWAVEYYDDDFEQETATRRTPDQESKLFRARLHFQPTPVWRFSASAGREENNFVREDELQREDIYGLGVAWRPGPRTNLEVQYEHRFFGDAPLVRFSHRTRLTAWELSYSRDTTNFQEEVLRLPPGNVAGLVDSVFAARIPDPVQRRTAVQEFLRVSGIPPFLTTPVSFFTQGVYLRESFNASVGILGVRNSITFTAYYSENEKLSSEAAVVPDDAFQIADRFTQQGFGARFDHKITPVTTLALSATRTYARHEDPVSFDSRTDYVALAVNRTVTPKTIVFAGVSVTHFESDDTGPDNQDANSIFVGLQHRF